MAGVNIVGAPYVPRSRGRTTYRRKRRSYTPRFDTKKQTAAYKKYLKKGYTKSTAAKKARKAKTEKGWTLKKTEYENVLQKVPKKGYYYDPDTKRFKKWPKGNKPLVDVSKERAAKKARSSAAGAAPQPQFVGDAGNVNPGVDMQL